MNDWTSPLRIRAHIKTNDLRYKVKLSNVIDSGGLPYYEGEYVVIPRKVEQSLATKNKAMNDDVVVRAINRADVVNVGGGLTVTIGFE